MKIALINSEYPSPSGADHGGIATYTYTLANLLVKHGHKVHILTRSGIHTNEIDPSIHVHQISFKSDKRLLPKIIGKLYQTGISWDKGLAFSIRELLLEIIKDDGLDIVEYPDYGGLGIYCHTIASLPSVVTLHTPSVLVDELNRIDPTSTRRQLYRMEEKSIKLATTCKSPSVSLKNYVCDKYGMNSSRITVVHNPLDITGLENGFNIPDRGRPSRFDILFCGRLEYRKGADVLLKSIKNILAINNQIHITIAGETRITGHLNYHTAIENILSSEERLRVSFPGPVPSKTLLTLYRSSSLFLFPSLFENSPYALLEAMACGLPVVASSTGGINEIIKHGENGLLFSLEDNNEPSVSIAALFNDRDRAIAIGRNAATSVVKNYAPDKIVNEYITIYQSAINTISGK